MNKALSMEVDDVESRYHWIANYCFGCPHGELLRDEVSGKATYFN